MAQEENTKSVAFSIDSILSRKDGSGIEIDQSVNNKMTQSKRSDGESSDNSESFKVSEQTTSASSAFPELDMNTLQNVLSTQGSLRSKRYRHKFTKEQLNRLQQTFMQSMYLNSAERSQLADELNLTDIQLKMWFQNRRMRMRKSFKKTAAGQKQYSSSIIQAHQHQNNPFTLPRCRSVIPMPSSHCREDFNGYKSVQNLYHRPNISLQYAADQLQHRPSFHHPHKTRIVFPPRFSPYPRQPQYHQCNHIQYRPENRKQMSSIPKERSSNQPTKNSDAPVQRLQDGKIVVKKGVVDLTDKEHCETSINPRPVNTLIPASAQLDDRLVGLQNYVLSEGRYMFQPRRWQFVNKE